MTTTSDDRGRILAEAAFGGEPQRWPLPAATTPLDRWRRAVAAGGQGRYAAALTDLALLERSAEGSLRSLGRSTRASFLRQLGGHRDGTNGARPGSANVIGGRPTAQG